MDWIFFLTLLFIFLAALVGIFVQRRSLDRCLKDFRGYHVSVEFQDAPPVWGRLVVYTNALELLYLSPKRGPDGEVETSAILLQDRLGAITALKRYHDELTPKNQEKRLRAVESLRRRGFLKRIGRRIRNLFNTFRDAFNQSIGLVVAQAKTKVGSEVLKTQDARIAQIGQGLVGLVANQYEPVLERYIGRRVIVDARLPEGARRFAGLLKEYSAGWVEILHVRLREERALRLSDTERFAFDKRLEVDFKEADGPERRAALRIRNLDSEPLRLVRVEGPGLRRDLECEIPPGEECELVVALAPPEAAQDAGPESGELPDLYLVLRDERVADLCLPRSLAFVRYGSDAAAPGEGTQKTRGRERAEPAAAGASSASGGTHGQPA